MNLYAGITTNLAPALVIYVLTPIALEGLDCLKKKEAI